MKQYFLVVVAILAIGGLSTIPAQNGFIVWAKGGDCERDLKFNKIEKGELGPEEQVVTEQGVAPSWVNISYDGLWIAFCRVDSAFDGKYGKCDGHKFDKWDLYVAKIDNGKALPATPIKVDRGYFPSWSMDENAKDPGKPKLLYYTRYSDQTIRKAVINPDGSIASKDEIHAACPKLVQGTNAHTQGSPDGKIILYRPHLMQVYNLELGKHISGNLSSKHPSWGPRSKYFMLTPNTVLFSTDTSVERLGAAFPFKQDYWQAISNDSHWDEGKLWAVGRESTGSTRHTRGKPMHFVEVDISNNGWKVSKVTDIGPEGVTGDIHIWKGAGPPMKTSFFPPSEFNGVDVNARISAGPVGLRLIIESVEPSFSAALYNLQGTRKAFTGNSAKSQAFIPLNGISDGTYMLKLETEKGSAQKAIQITR